MKKQLWTAPLPHGNVEIIYEDPWPCTGVGVLSLRWHYREKIAGDVVLMRHLDAPGDARFRRASIDEQKNITIVFAVGDTEETVSFPLLLSEDARYGFRKPNTDTVPSTSQLAQP